MFRFSPYSVFILLVCAGSAAHAQPANYLVDCDKIPANWQPAIAFYKADQASGSGVYFFEVSRDDNKGISRIEKLHVAYDVKDGGRCAYRIEHDLSPYELRNAYVVKVVSGRRVTTLKSDDATDQGGTIQMTVLKEANAVFADDYSQPMYFTVGLSNGRATAWRHGKVFNVMKVWQLWKSFPTKGKIPAGVKKIEFLSNNANVGADFVP